MANERHGRVFSNVVRVGAANCVRGSTEWGSGLAEGERCLLVVYELRGGSEL